MRAIAQRAGVSTGNAYYYFSSKEELVQRSARSHAEHLAASRPVLDRERDFTARLGGTLRAWIDVQAPYHAFAATFYKHAAEPTSPLSPFSGRSSPTREASIGLYREVLEGSNARVSGDLARACRAALAGLDGHHPVLGARHVAGLRPDLPADRRRRAGDRKARGRRADPGAAQHTARHHRHHRRAAQLTGGTARDRPSRRDRPGAPGQADRARAQHVRRAPSALPCRVRSAGHNLLGGVPMTWMRMWPGGFPLYLAGATGARLTDVDGHGVHRLLPRRHRSDGRALQRRSGRPWPAK